MAWQRTKILVTESWCNAGITDAFLSINSYELQTDLRMDRDDTVMGRGGGLPVYARSGVQILKNDNQVKFHQSCSFTVHDIMIHLVYRLPNSPPEAMRSLVELVKSIKKDSIMIGDFNLPDIDWTTGCTPAKGREFVDAVEDMHMTQLVNFATVLQIRDVYP